MKKEIIIHSIQPGSAAGNAGVEPGDVLLSVNGQTVGDIFDYRFLTSEPHVEMKLKKKNGMLVTLKIDKDQYEDPGIEFEDPLISGVKSCNNKCIFCFIDQLPKGMRDTLYFKDDDSRLSFLSGNYVTLTNMRENELERIVRYKMSPVNVSVHTTNPELRKFILGNRFAGNILEKIGILVKGGIKVNAQIVLLKDINDGTELDRTVDELSALYPGIASISVVPVGLTRWREGLHRLEPFGPGDAADVLEQVESRQKVFLKRYGTRLVYLADEFYIKAGKDLPLCEEYEDFPQFENGVGMMSLLIDEFFEYMKKNTKKMDRHAGKPGWARNVSIATGKCAFSYIKQLAQVLERRYNNLKVNVYPIENLFFGENVTVTGLLTGGDIYRQLDGLGLGSELLLSRSMLKSGEELFLDDVDVKGLSGRLGTKIAIVENEGGDLIKKILGMYRLKP
jgi:putative radical SAM enzyme (TIGR03279 family)